MKFATGMMDLLKDNTWLYSLKHDMTFQDSVFKKIKSEQLFIGSRPYHGNTGHEYDFQN